MSEFHIFAASNTSPCTVPPRADALFRPLSRHHREEDAENAGGKIPD